MIDLKAQYIETTNLYLEMLWQAQRIEDRKLVALLHRRLFGPTTPKTNEAPCCRIFPFPATAGQIHHPLPIPAFWPSRPVTITLAGVATYCLLLVLGILGYPA